jgi:hypothetical protein
MPLLWLPVLLEPGGQTRHEFRPPLSMVPRGWPYSGKTVMLIRAGREVLECAVRYLEEVTSAKN